MNNATTQASKHYYARHCSYGINVIFEEGDGSVDRFPGMIARFNSRKARDAWVEDEIWDGKFCREAMSARDVASAGRHHAFCGELTWYPVTRDEEPDHVYETL